MALQEVVIYLITLYYEFYVNWVMSAVGAKFSVMILL